MKTDAKSSSALEEFLGTRSKVAVLRVLFRTKLGLSGGAISRQAGVALFAVQRALAALESMGLIEAERGSGEYRFRLNAAHYLVENGLRAMYEGERHMLGALARDLRSLLEGKVLSAGLFGSYARGAAAANSDIDLLIVVETVDDRERVSRIISDSQRDLTRRYGWPLQAVIFERRRLAQAVRKGPSLFDEAMRDWEHVAGMQPQALRTSLGRTRSRRRLHESQKSTPAQDAAASRDRLLAGVGPSARQRARSSDARRHRSAL